MKVYRVENQTEQHGLWRDFDGTWNPVFQHLTDGQCRELPMDDSDEYRKDRKWWFASAPSKETLKHWLSQIDAVELQALGYYIYEFDVNNHRAISEYETVFTRDSVVSQRQVEVSEIWKEALNV